MKLFAVAFGIACGVGVILFATTFAILTLVGIGEPVAAATALGALPITAFPKIGEFLERQEGRKSLAAGKRAPIYDFRGFQIAWPLMIVYGTIVLWSVGQAAVGIPAFMLGQAHSDDENVDPTTLLFPLTHGVFPLVSVLAAYFVGRWIGTRCSRQGVVTMLLVAFFTAAGIVAIDVAGLTDEAYRASFGGERLAYSFTLLRIAALTLMLLVAGLLGYWRGQKYRLSKYLHYLLGVLPAETRDAVIELALEEAQKAPAATGRARISAT